MSDEAGREGTHRHGPPPWVTGRWRGERPPWWPEGEQWPPRQRWRLARRVVLFFAVAFTAVLAVIAFIVVAIVSLVARAVGLTDLSLPGTTAIVAAVILFLVLFGVSGPFRRYARPIAQLVDAVDRVAGGDYTVRVDAHGPSRSVRRLAGSFNAMVERLATSDELRRRLLADVTHELRTPLTVIQGQLEGAIDGVYPRDEAHLRAILDETHHMARIVDDLRTLSLAESGALTLSREPAAIGAIVDDAVDAYAAQADAAGVALAADVPEDLPAVDADATRIREVLENLLSNALRYTPRGGRIDVAVSHDRDGVAVTVRDTGRGIAREDLPRVFERFERSADSRGSGLGLAIARDLVRAHGGEITVASEGEGRGTTVRFSLPVARADPA